MAAKHEVTCIVCHQKFDTNIEQAVHHGKTRYAHASCEPDNQDFVPMITVDPDLVALDNYIKEVLGESANWAMIKKEEKEFIEEKGYSYSGILKTLQYFYDVQHNSSIRANGHLGIVPFVYQDAYNYYYSIFMAHQSNCDKTLVTQIKEYSIPVPKSQGTLHRTLDWSIEDEEQ